MKTALFALFLSAFSLILPAQDRSVSASVKKQVLARDGGRCRCCGSTANIEYDHIIAFSKGGSNEACNIQLLCRPCNRSKSDNSHCGEHHRRLDAGSCDTYKASKAKSTAVRCTGYTKKGTRCRNMTHNANGRCHLH